MKNNFLWITTISLLLFSCTPNRPSYDVDVSGIEIGEVSIHRYENALFGLDPENLQAGLKNIAEEYAVFLGTDLEDTSSIRQIFEYVTDPKIIELYGKTDSMYPDLINIEDQLSGAFRHYKYYFPESTTPSVYTYISGLHFENPVEYNGEVLVIGLDLYLGKDYLPYKQIGLPNYIVKRMTPDYLTVDCAKAMSYAWLPAKRNLTLLDEMITNGKILYFTDAMLPETHDSIKIGYPRGKTEWCFDNEANIWAFMISNDLIYSRDFQAVKKLINEAPFTAGMGHDSPGRIGVWLGWQIVREYMNSNPDLTLQEMMMNKDSQEILIKSGYKPGK